MPRVENCGPSVEDFCQKTGNGSSTYDVCWECNDLLIEDPHYFDDKLKPYNGDPLGEDGWIGDEIDHPPYDQDDYRCAVCNAQLNREDE